MRRPWFVLVAVVLAIVATTPAAGALTQVPKRGGTIVIPAFEPVDAQDRLRAMPGYDQFTKMSKQLEGGAFVSGAVNPTWAADGQSFTYTIAGRPHRFDVATMNAAATNPPPRARTIRAQIRSDATPRPTPAQAKEASMTASNQRGAPLSQRR